MPPRTDAPRLASLDSGALASEARRLAEYHRGLLDAMLPGAVRTGGGEFGPLGAEIIRLVVWAQTGAWPGCSGPLIARAKAWQALGAVVAALYGSAVQPHPDPLRWSFDVRSPLGCLMLAAVARAQLVDGRATTVERWAALASMSSSQAARIMATQTDEHGLVPADAGVDVLRHRGVPI